QHASQPAQMLAHGLLRSLRLKRLRAVGQIRFGIPVTNGVQQNRLDVPDCGQALKFTMFAPPGYQGQEAEEPSGKEAWHEQSAAYEQLEVPLGARLTQIGAGIGIYYLISRTVLNFFFVMCFMDNDNFKLEQMLHDNSKLEQMMSVYLVLLLVFHIVGALAGGAVAGAWSVNWTPQGIGVGIGVFVTPLITYFVFEPIQGVNLPVMLVVVCVTTAFSVLGAFIGHTLIRPTRYLVS
ncbi:MAG: hypothetical protein ACWGMZ_11560, partial [Thermoguttaceae bacterium]